MGYVIYVTAAVSKSFSRRYIAKVLRNNELIVSSPKFKTRDEAVAAAVADVRKLRKEKKL